MRFIGGVRMKKLSPEYVVRDLRKMGQCCPNTDTLDNWMLCNQMDIIKSCVIGSTCSIMHAFSFYPPSSWLICI